MYHHGALFVLSSALIPSFVLQTNIFCIKSSLMSTSPKIIHLFCTFSYIRMWFTTHTRHRDLLRLLFIRVYLRNIDKRNMDSYTHSFFIHTRPHIIFVIFDEHGNVKGIRISLTACALLYDEGRRERGDLKLGVSFTYVCRWARADTKATTAKK